MLQSGYEEPMQGISRFGVTRDETQYHHASVCGRVFKGGNTSLPKQNPGEWRTNPHGENYIAVLTQR